VTNEERWKIRSGKTFRQRGKWWKVKTKLAKTPSSERTWTMRDTRKERLILEDMMLRKGQKI